MRNIKRLALVAFATMAITATVGATGATAAEFVAEAYPTTLSSTYPSNHSWTFHTASQSCPAPQLSGTLSSPATKLEPSAADVLSGCKSLTTGNQLKMNGCKFTYRPGAKTGSSTFNGTVDIGPVGCGPISFSGGGASVCNVTVPAQKELSATYENVGEGSKRAVMVNVSAVGLKHTQVSGSDCSGSLGTYSDGSWTGSWKIQGTSGMWVAGSGGFELPTTGIAINGTTPALVAGTYPMTVTGTQLESNKHVLTFQAGSVKCGTATFISTVTGPSSQYTVTPEYKNCTAFGLSSVVKMEGCVYTFKVLNQPPIGNSYTGHADISCPEGKTIRILAGQNEAETLKTKCTVTIPTQTTDSEGLTFTNEVASSTIGLGIWVTGIDYHQQKGEGFGACTTTGDFTTGSYAGSSALVGSY